MRALTLASIAAACMLAAAVPAARAAAAPAHSTSGVHLRTLRLGAGNRLAVAPAGSRGAETTVTLDAGARFSMAGLVCDVPPAGAVSLALRASTDGASWTRWFTAPLEIVDEPGRPAQAYIDPVWTGPASYVQLKARGSDGAPVALSGVRVVAIDPGAPSTAAASATSPAAALAASSGAASGQVTSAAATTRAANSQPAIVTRSEWGADESLRGDPPSYSPVKMAFVHHTDGNNTYAQADAPGIVRGIYAFHTTALHWNDIGYNFLIDRFGTIYEGRYGGISRGVIGAQVGGFNTGSTGVSVIGNFMTVAPPAAVISSLERLLSWKLTVSGVDPLGTTTLTCGLADRFKLGQTVSFNTISGHRDANYTDCPGDRFYPLLPGIRDNVAERMGGGGGTTVVPKLTADRTLVSPNGDGVRDDVRFSVALSAAADWRLVVRNAGGASVASWSGTGASASVTWDGRSGGDVVPDGDYAAELTSSAGASSSTAALTVDTSAPRLDKADAAPQTFSPDGDGQTEATSVTYTPAEACSVRVGIQDADGKVVRWLRGWRAEKAAGQTARWDGRITSGGTLVAAPDGQYRFDIERRDAAGNIGRKGLKVVLDRTLGYPTVSPASFSPNEDGKLDATKVGFKLTRKAAVMMTFTVAGGAVRTISAGTLAAGAHSITWDGRGAGGSSLASSRVDVTLTAESSLGTSAVATTATIDLSRPRIYAGGSRTVTAGTSTSLGYKVTDAFSAKADVRFVITDAKGRTVASGHPGKVTTGTSHTTAWKPTARGTFTVTWHATDLAGNSEAEPARTVVTVR